MQHRTAVRSALACLALAAGATHAQVTQKPDGQWRSLFTAGASVANGNSVFVRASITCPRSVDWVCSIGAMLVTCADCSTLPTRSWKSSRAVWFMDRQDRCFAARNPSQDAVEIGKTIGYVVHAVHQWVTARVPIADAGQGRTST